MGVQNVRSIQCRQWVTSPRWADFFGSSAYSNWIHKTVFIPVLQGQHLPTAGGVFSYFGGQPPKLLDGRSKQRWKWLQEKAIEASKLNSSISQTDPTQPHSLYSTFSNNTSSAVCLSPLPNTADWAWSETSRQRKYHYCCNGSELIHQLTCRSIVGIWRIRFSNTSHHEWPCFQHPLDSDKGVSSWAKFKTVTFCCTVAFQSA